MVKTLAVIASMSGLLAVALGAFGAHGLRGKIPDTLFHAFETAVQYHFYHTLALLVLVFYLLATSTARLLVISSWLFIAGIVAFSGSLYLITLGAPKWLGPITPIGGLLFMAGWVVLAVYCFTTIKNS